MAGDRGAEQWLPDYNGTSGRPYPTTWLYVGWFVVVTS